MTASSVALVLFAAVLHSSWNALAKRAGDPLRFLWLSNCVASIALAPVAIVMLARGELTPSGVPFVAATVALHAVYFYALGRAYRTGELSLVYPIARGLGVALVPVIALGVLGICLVVLGVAGLHGLPRLGVTPAGMVPLGAATAWAILTGLTVAAYSVVDKAGSVRVSPPLYMALMEVGTVCVVAPAVLRGAGRLRGEWTANWRAIVFVGVASPAAYIMVLFAFQSSKTGYVVAARELSIVFSALIGTVWLREGRGRARLVGAAVILAGVVCVAAAR